MDLILLFFILPLVAAFLLQLLLIRKVKHGIARHAALLPAALLFLWAGYEVLTASGQPLDFSGLFALFLLAGGVCALTGCALAWGVFFIRRAFYSGKH